MSLSSALSNAVSGLAVSARGTEIVADNLANVQTPGFARREMHISSSGLSGGVRIDGVDRVINTGLVAQLRRADAARSDTAVRMDFFQRVEGAIKLPGDPDSLSEALNAFQSSIVEASRRPDSNNILENVAISAQKFTSRLRNASETVRNMGASASSDIKRDVGDLNQNLSQIAYLNRKISILTNQGKSVVSLIDKRHILVNKINQIVPFHEVPRENGAISLFTSGGQSLLDGTTPTQFEFASRRGGQSAGQLMVNGKPLSAAEMKFMAGGSLHANYDVVKELVPQVLHQLDSFAMDLHNLFSDPATDTTIGEGSVGFFADDQGRANSADLKGLSARLTLNPLIDPENDGDLWRIRDGLGAEVEGAVGNSELVKKLSSLFEKNNSVFPGSAFQRSSSINGRLTEIETNIISKRLLFEKDLTSKNSSVDALSASILEDGVNTDAELQKLITLGQAYAANARVVQAVDEMMDQILRW